MSTDGPEVVVEERDHVAWVTLARPERLNAFTGAGYRSLRHAVERADAEPAVRVIVLTGSGRAFSAGADRSLLDGTAEADDLRLAGEEFGAVLDAFEGCATPVLAAVNGLAVGIGATLLLRCDLVLMATSARLRLPFTALGVPPEAASSVLLAQRTRWADAAWAMLSSEWIDATTAHEMGFAWRVVADDELLAEAAAAAAAIAEHDPAAVAATKRLMLAGRAELARAAMERELAAWQALRADRGPTG